jgi:hypothetical protein
MLAGHANGSIRDRFAVNSRVTSLTQPWRAAKHRDGSTWKAAAQEWIV